jgi:hypothetical protein
MLSSKIMFILLALLIASFTFCNVNTKVKENYGGRRIVKPTLVQIEKITEKNFYGEGKNKVTINERPASQDVANLILHECTSQNATNTMSKLSDGAVTLQSDEYTMENYNNKPQYIENYNKPNVDFYQVPNFQANLSPRESFSNNTFPGSNIIYNLPEEDNTAYNYVDMVQENYSRENGCYNKNKKFFSALDPTIKPGYMCGSDSYYGTMGQKQSSNQSSSFGTNNISTTLPISTMENISDSTSEYNEDDIKKDAEGVETEIYNAVRYVFANHNSRTRGQACQLRGDLFIVPSPQISKSSYGITDLHQGALSSISGFNAENTSQKHHAMLNASVGLKHFSGEILPTSMISKINGLTDVSIAMN